MFEIKIHKKFKAMQGLTSPVRRSKGLSSLVPEDGFAIEMTVGITFEESQLKQQGWFVDTDAVDEHIDTLSRHLQSDTWTALFDFRPTFELVSKWAYEYLEDNIPQIAYVELENTTIQVSTVYAPSKKV